MTEGTIVDSEKTRFYLRLTLIVSGWTLLGLVAQRLAGIDGGAAYVVLMSGLLAILAGAMRHPAYLRIRGYVKNS